MDSKVIVLLVFILFAIVISYMVANGMIDITSIFSRVTKNQAHETLGGVKLEIVSPVPGVYYQASDITVGSDTYKGIDLKDVLKITGNNLNGKTLTVSVASPHWYLVEGTNLVKTVQRKFDTNSDMTLSDNVWTLTNSLDLVRGDTDKEPFSLPEFVELVFAVGEVAKAEVTIVVEPSA